MTVIEVRYECAPETWVRRVPTNQATCGIEVRTTTSLKLAVEQKRSRSREIAAVTVRLLQYLETLVFVNTAFHNRNCACSVFLTVPVLGGTM